MEAMDFSFSVTDKNFDVQETCTQLNEILPSQSYTRVNFDVQETSTQTQLNDIFPSQSYTQVNFDVQGTSTQTQLNEILPSQSYTQVNFDVQETSTQPNEIWPSQSYTQVNFDVQETSTQPNEIWSSQSYTQLSTQPSYYLGHAQTPMYLGFVPGPLHLEAGVLPTIPPGQQRCSTEVSHINYGPMLSIQTSYSPGHAQTPMSYPGFVPGPLRLEDSVSPTSPPEQQICSTEVSHTNYGPMVIREEPAKRDNQTCWDNVCFMMHLFGDVQEPLPSSVSLVNNLLESQMDILIEKCENAMKLRGAAEMTISHEDVLFLMRRNKVLLKCLLRFLDDNSQVHECLAFLGSIEKFAGDLTSFYNKNIIDHTAKKRFKRTSSTTWHITDPIDDSGIKSFEDEFLSNLGQMHPHIRSLFSLKTNQKSAGSPEAHVDNSDEFMKWLCNCRFKYPAEYPYKISPLAASIIDFLAIQTVAGLVKKALCMRSRACEREEKKPSPLLTSENFQHHIRLFDDAHDDESENNFSDLSTLSAFPKVALCPKNPESYSSSAFIKHMGNPPVIIPMRQESEILPEKPITPAEIQTAFVHYQRPKPMSLLMKSKFPYLQKREVNLICLAFSAEEFEL